MPLVIDTSAVIAVIGDEPLKPRVLELTQDQQLVAPPTLPWGVCNAFSAMFKRRQIELSTGLGALTLFHKIPIEYTDVSLDDVVRTSHELNVYAYDACMVVCARQERLPLLTLDRGLRDAARRAGIAVIEVTP